MHDDDQQKGAHGLDTVHLPAGGGSPRMTPRDAGGAS